MFERFSRSWSLIKASAEVLSKDKQLLLFPLISTICSLVVVAAFMFPAVGLGTLDALADDGGDLNGRMYLLGFLFYLVQYTVIFFFNTALVGAAMIRFDGGTPTLGHGLRIARSKLGPILGYAAIAATIGLVLRMIQERSGALGRFVVGLLGAAWTVASFLVVPILVSRDVGPVDAVKESARLLKSTWGENLIGQGGIGLIFGLMYFALAMLGMGIFTLALHGGNVAVIGAVMLALLLAAGLMALVHSALSGIYAAALYRHAVGEASTAAFAPDLLDEAFVTRT